MEEVKYAMPEELRAMADLIDTQNEVARGLTQGGVLYLDNIQVTDSNGVPLGVIVWRTEADGFGLRLG